MISEVSWFPVPCQSACSMVWAPWYRSPLFLTGVECKLSAIPSLKNKTIWLTLNKAIWNPVVSVVTVGEAWSNIAAFVLYLSVLLQEKLNLAEIWASLSVSLPANLDYFCSQGCSVPGKCQLDRTQGKTDLIFWNVLLEVSFALKNTKNISMNLPQVSSWKLALQTAEKAIILCFILSQSIFNLKSTLVKFENGPTNEIFGNLGTVVEE